MILGFALFMTFALLMDGLLIVLFVFNFKKYAPVDTTALPTVSILVAAKNEEETVNRCIDSLLKLSYPQDKLEILIGNDASDDNTLAEINVYDDKYTHIRVLDIKDKIGDQHGKANVILQLAREAKGECYLVTDADMALPTDWVQYMVSAMQKNVGLAIGVTQVQENRFQDLDWLYALCMIKVVTDLGLPVTGMGNNMIISKEAYEAAGGYEALPFSITEDYELFRHINGKGYQCAHVFQEEVLGTTLPIRGFFNLLNQRKRWMKGAAKLPIPMLLLLSLQPGFYIGIIGMLILFPKMALLLLTLKFVLRFLLMTSIRTRLNISFRFLSVAFYEMYGFFLVIASGLYYLLPTKIVWKGREY